MSLDAIEQQLLLAIAEGIDTALDLDLEYPFVSRHKQASRLERMRQRGLLTIGDRIELTAAGLDQVAELGGRPDAA